MTERMGTRLAVLAGAACITGASLAGVATPAGAQQTDPAAVVVFTAGANVSEDYFFPGLGPSAEGADYSFSTDNPGILGANLCAGVAFDGSLTSGVQFSHPDPNVPTIDESICELSSEGTVRSDLGSLGGPFCGYLGDSGTAELTIGNRHFGGITVEWPPAAGTVQPLVFGGSVIGVGAAHVETAPGTCGLDGPTTSFSLTGFAAVADPGNIT